VSFAGGDETPEEIYGDEERLVRLRALKAKWDPEGISIVTILSFEARARQSEKMNIGN
jgi:hypothetical protein